VYADGHKAPDPAQSDPNVPFDLPDPPQGRFAAVTDMNGPGTRILYRDLRLDGWFTLQVNVFYAGTAPLSSPKTLAHEANQQFRIDLVGPSAPIESVAKGDVLVNVFRTSPRRPARTQQRYGYGFDVQGQGPLRSYGHGGGAPGMNGELRVFPQLGYVVVSLSNLDPPAASELVDFFALRDAGPVAALRPPGVRAEIPAAVACLKRIAFRSVRGTVL
jgi:CubicO group peptidase (beta-lactamase class C family)